ncbi:hypothetical protein AADX85_13695 [Staphylococcus epidermidis]
MKKIGQLKKWPLVVLVAQNFGVGVSTNPVNAHTKKKTDNADTQNQPVGPGLA